MMITVIASVAAMLTILISTVYLYFIHSFKYWKNRNVPFVQPSFPYGNFKGAGKKYHINELVTKFYRQLKGSGPFGGVYTLYKPTVVALDLDFIKTILIKDFNNFHERGIFNNEKDDPLSAHMFAMEGEKWRNLRSKLSPTFTSGKMKYMFPTIVNIANEFKSVLAKAILKSDEQELKDIVSRFTTDVIGTCAFGIDCNSLEYPNSEFHEMGKRFFNTQPGGLKRLLLTNCIKLGRMMRLKVVDEKVSNFFLRIVKETVNFREKNNIRRNDFMDLLIQLKNETTPELPENVSGKITIEQISAHAFVFFLAGFETSSSLMSYCLYELALQPSVQRKLREKNEQVLLRHNGVFSYEAIQEMTYMEQVLNGNF